MTTRAHQVSHLEENNPAWVIRETAMAATQLVNTSLRHIKPTPVGDLGVEQVEGVYHQFQIDPEWSLPEPCGYSWWPHRLRQRVWSEPGFDDEGETIWRLCAEIVLLEGVAEEALEQTVQFGRAPLLTQLLIDPEQRTASLLTSIYMHQGNAGWLVPQLFATMTALQVIEAERELEVMVRLFGGEPAIAPHPTRGVRLCPDQILELGNALLKPMGDSTSAWRGSREFSECAERLEQVNCVANSDPDGLTVEFPFGPSDISQLHVRVDQPDPVLGHGLSLSLCLPVVQGLGVTTKLIHRLAQAELRVYTRAHGYGTWSVLKTRGGFVPVYRAFVPNAIYAPTLMTNLVFTELLRAQWVAGLLKPDEPECDVREVYAARCQESLSDTLFHGLTPWDDDLPRARKSVRRKKTQAE